ncbi:MAG: heme lyase CcmF/NrfE family subunit [Gemmatimonadaceae bacterium]
MTRLIGANALIIALGTSVVALLLTTLGGRRGKPQWIAAGYTAAYLQFGFVTIAAFAMIFALTAHDFSVSYVAQVGSRATPLFYTVISLWGALEGSILFWAWVLALLTSLVVFWNRDGVGKLIPYTTATMLGAGIFFQLLLVGPANPFGLVSPVPADGPGPNPLLQNHILMGVHPPLLYLGYVGMTVPFAFALGAMASGQVADGAWIRLSRRWTLGAWAFLTSAIIAGMWWSYEVLGWGGYWAWDPVENASFLPWLTATAFLHSVMVQERRGLLKLWNLNLIVATFALTIFGTFLTRSGVLSSVHAFTEGAIGYYFLAAIAIVLLLWFVLVAGNSDELGSDAKLEGVAARGTIFLFNNLFLTAFTFTVLVGTLFPLVAEAARGVKVSVGEPFYNRMTVPICVALLFLMGVGPALPWKEADRATIKRKLLPPAIGAVVALGLGLVAGARSAYPLLGFAFAGFAAVGNIGEFVAGTRHRMRQYGEALATAFGRLIATNRRRYGGYTAHLGIVAVAVSITASSTFKTEHEATLARGESMTVRGLNVRFNDVYLREEPQRTVIGANVSVLRQGREVGRMDPRMNFYPTSQQPVPTPAVRSRPWGDVYVNLMSFTQDGSNATLRVIVEPLVPWIWFGGFIICCGAVISMGLFSQRAPAPAAAAERAEEREAPVTPSTPIAAT